MCTVYCTYQFGIDVVALSSTVAVCTVSMYCTVHVHVLLVYAVSTSKSISSAIMHVLFGVDFIHSKIILGSRKVFDDDGLTELIASSIVLCLFCGGNMVRTCTKCRSNVGTGVQVKVKVHVNLELAPF